MITTNYWDDWYYLSDDKRPVRCQSKEDMRKWRTNKIVRQEHVGTTYVSTVFLGLDHSFGDSKPILFETMIFGGAFNEFQARYHTWEEAIAGHAHAVTLAKAGWLRRMWWKARGQYQ